MAIVPYQPNTIWLGGPRTEVNDKTCGVAICPGMLVERYNSAGALLWRPNTNAGAAAGKFVATENSHVNKSVSDGYAIGDLVEVSELGGGSSAWMLIASGQNITQGNFLESNGDGTLKVHSAGTSLFVALETVNNTNGNGTEPTTGQVGAAAPAASVQPGGVTALPAGAARIRVEVL